MIALLFMWFGIDLPLVFLGFYFGYRKQVSMAFYLTERELSLFERRKKLGFSIKRKVAIFFSKIYINNNNNNFSLIRTQSAPIKSHVRCPNSLGTCDCCLAQCLPESCPSAPCSSSYSSFSRYLFVLFLIIKSLLEVHIVFGKKRNNDDKKRRLFVFQSLFF